MAIGIAKQANETSLVGFVKLANSFIFSVDTGNIVIAQTAGSGRGGNYNQDGKALFTAASTNHTYKNAVNAAIVCLKGIALAAGGMAWSNSIMINGRAVSSLEQQAFNWKNPAQYNYTYNGSFTYNADGTQFTGTNHIRTSLIPLTALTGTTTDVAVVNVVGTNPTPAGIIFGNIGNNVSSFYTQITASLFYHNIYAGEIGVTSPSPVGRFITFYSTPNTLNALRNGVILHSRTVTVQTAAVSSELFEGAANEIGNANYFSSAR